MLKRSALAVPMHRHVAIWLLAGATFLPTSVGAQSVGPDLWGTDGNVSAIARLGNTLYIGGAFTAVGPCTGSGIPLSRCSGLAPERYPKVAGRVRTVVSDGRGGWFIGGSFSSVGGEPCHNLAHVTADGEVDRWNPDLDGVSVECLALDGRTLFVGGQFSRAGSEARNAVAAIDIVTASAREWTANVEGEKVSALALHGRELIIGGVFSRVGGQQRSCVAAVDLRTGFVTPWSPQADGWVQAIAVLGDDIYLGGSFTRAGSASRAYVAQINARSGLATSWNPQVSATYYPYDDGPWVGAIVAHGSSIFIAGHFSQIGARDRGGVAELDAKSGAATDWDAHIGPRYDWIAPYIGALAVSGNVVYLGGGFTNLSGAARSFVGAVSALSGRPSEWDPHANHVVDALAVSGETVYAGGRFSSMGPWVSRIGLAALDLTTGAALPWNPDPNGLAITSLASTANTVYVGGDFTFIGGQDRSGIAALDPTTGQATSWNPQANESIYALALDGGMLFVGGGFTQIGGQSRRHIAALDAVTGAATNWNPAANAEVVSLAVSGPVVYAGGFFSQIGGAMRLSIAALDKTTGSATAWDPSGDGLVLAIAATNEVVYAGGIFNTIGGQSRSSVAALDPATGLATGWDAHLSPRDHLYPRVLALTTLGSQVFIGGDFGSAGGHERYGFAALDGGTAEATAWNPAPDNYAWSLLADGNTLYVGGRFQQLGGIPRASLAAVQFPATSPAIASVARAGAEDATIRLISPNPARGDAIVRFALSNASEVSVALYDVQGRLVLNLLDRSHLKAGEFSLPVRSAGLPVGAYLCRVEVGSTCVTRKLLVVR